MTRTITSNPTFTQEETSGYLYWNFNAALPTLSRNIAVEMRYSTFLYFETANVSDTGIFNEGTKLGYTLKENYDYETYLVGCYIKPSTAQGFTLNGVTYNLGVREYSFDSAAYETQIPLDSTITVNGDVWSFTPAGAEGHSVDGITNAHLSSLPQDWVVSDSGAEETTFTLASENEVMLDSAEAFFAINVTNGEDVTNLDQPETTDDYQIGLNFTQGGKNFTTLICSSAQSGFDW